MKASVAAYLAVHQKHHLKEPCIIILDARIVCYCSGALQDIIKSQYTNVQCASRLFRVIFSHQSIMIKGCPNWSGGGTSSEESIHKCQCKHTHLCSCLRTYICNCIHTYCSHTHMLTYVHTHTSVHQSGLKCLHQNENSKYYGNRKH